uniref:Uncharacterized protein n=1 Tax=viral metagenome TaxID=1070528 RepID=A0A6C0JI15_9ZZZZ
MANTDKTTLLRAFNKHFFDFMDDIISIYPTNEEIISGRASFDLVKRANPTAILKAWYYYVYSPYKSVIEQGEISFFFEKDYGQDVGHLPNSNELMDIIDKIRGPIKQMDGANRAHTAKYIQNLSKISTMYVNLSKN